MYKLTLYVPMMYSEENEKGTRTVIAIHKTETEIPPTEETTFSLQVSGETFLFHPVRALHSFEDKESAVVLAFSSPKKNPRRDLEVMSEKFYNAVQNDSGWDIQRLHPAHFLYFIKNIAVPVSFGMLTS